MFAEIVTWVGKPIKDGHQEIWPYQTIYDKLTNHMSKDKHDLWLAEKAIIDFITGAVVGFPSGSGYPMPKSKELLNLIENYGKERYIEGSKDTADNFAERNRV